MAQYNFEGDLENISDRQLQYINNVILERGFKNSKVTFAPVGKVGDNYAATVKRITVEGDNGNLSMIAKIAPTNEMNRIQMNSPLLFENEHTMYFEVLPKLVQLQKEAGVPEKELLRYAECYGSLSEKPNEVILLEDLKDSNFKILDRFVSLTDDAIKSVLKNFAKLHSFSYVLKVKEPETYNGYKEKLLDMWATQAANEDMKLYLKNLEDDTLTIVDDPEYIKVLKNKVGAALDTAARLSKADYDNKYAVILQGDSWTTNIMFRFEDDTLAESIMIDYQISRNSSPACDILYLIFNCTDYETRKEHYYDWIDYYHSELDKSLSNFNLKVNLVYPREELDADLKRYGSFVFGLCICLASMQLRNPDDAAKILDAMKSENIIDQIADLSVTQLNEDTKNLFRVRVMGMVDSCTEFGLL